MDINKILHYPRLDNVLIVEKLIYDTSGTYTRKQLWEKLPKKMMYQTFAVIIDYLIYSKKIAVDRVGKLAWTFDEEGTKKYLKRTDLGRK
jgi:endo-alpha-1,4-polygalactosaminidase (GH114 family)